MLRERSVRLDLQPYDLTDHKAPALPTEPEGCHTTSARPMVGDKAHNIHPMKKDVKKKSISPPLWEMRAW
jgi:hypothetical protein